MAKAVKSLSARESNMVEIDDGEGKVVACGQANDGIDESLIGYKASATRRESGWEGKGQRGRRGEECF